MELRTKEMLTSMGLYALLVLVIYYIALSQAGADFEVRRIAAGLLWLVFIFTSLLGLNRSLVHEKDQGCLEALLISPTDRPVIFFGKAVGNFIFLSIVIAITLPLFYLFFLASTEITGNLWLVPLPLVVGAVGIAGVGTLLATMSVNTKGKDFGGTSHARYDAAVERLTAKEWRRKYGAWRCGGCASSGRIRCARPTAPRWQSSPCECYHGTHDRLVHLSGG
mgnify:CR=1 FL=1